MDADLSVAERCRATTALLAVSPAEGNDIVARHRDALAVSKAEAYEDMLDVLDQLLECVDLNSHEKLVTVVTQYNRGVLDRCYENFAKLLKEESVLIDHRVEACRYLFASEAPRHKETAQQFLRGLIETRDYSCAWRYKLIANYLSTTGLGSVTNFGKLPVPYDEPFVRGLQRVFFANEQNSVRERLLSGQNLLEMESVQAEERRTVEASLLRVADDPRLPDGVRADAADILIRNTKGETKTQAQAVVAALGFGAVRARDRTVYNDRQNVHNTTIGQSVRRFIERIVTSGLFVPEPFHQVHSAVTKLIEAAALGDDDRGKCYRALDRISIDTSTFTEYRVSLSYIFSYVWTRVKKETKWRPELEQRLLQELVDMADTCSSGHTWRFVNVLSVYAEDIISISFRDQIVANLVGRLSARIREIDDDNLQDKVALGSLGSDAEPEEVEAYRSFVKKNLAEIKVELLTEFVDEGLVTLELFENYFTSGAERYI